MKPLQGRVALVTGGAKNVGKAIAKELGLRGATVLVNYFHSAEEAKRTEAELAALGIEVHLIRASVVRQDQVDRMFDQISAEFGRLDVLVNNAANGALLPLSELTDEHLDKAIETNYKGGLRCARAAAPLMARGGGGAIITVSALGSSQLVMANYAACAPAKAAAEAMTRYLAVEFAPLNIRVNTASAAMLTGPVADAFPRAADMQEAIRESTPMGRLGTPEELATVVAFLASDDSRWMTGQVVLADGGLSLGARLLSPPPAPASVVVRERQPEPEPVEDDIAIVGMGLAVAGANSPEEFWRLRTTGADLFVRPPADRWDRSSFHSPDSADEDKTYQDRFAFLTGFRPEPEAAGSELELTTAWLRHSLAQALRPVTHGPGDRISLLIGYTPDGSQHLEDASVLAGMRRRLAEAADELGVPGDRFARLDEVLTRRYRRGAVRPARFLPDRVGRLAMAGLLPQDAELQMIDTACSSSMYAIDIGMKGLSLGRQDIAVCGGAFALTPRAMVMFAKLHGLSKRGEVRAMDDAADGVLFADGAGIVVLKRLSRARRDGDRVLAVLSSTGSSSDGRGTAIYAPNAAGQDLAVRRAYPEGTSPADVDWVLTHATGTRAGDLAEFTTVREHFQDGQFLTSNKSLIGHTGWAAGVASVIEAVLALDQETIPGQFRFAKPQSDFHLEETGLKIPAEPVPWPRREDRPRAAGISGFGFGGTNAHLVVREHRPGPVRAPAAQQATERVAIVGWATDLPGLGSPAEVQRWVTGQGGGPADSFGATYPAPAFDRVRLPPATVRMMDRCQLMMVECAHRLQSSLPGLWRDHAETTGVFVGTMGPTRMGMLLANRVYLDEVTATLREDGVTGALPELGGLLTRLRDKVHGEIEPSNEDSFPGMMPNIISARVANRFDLNGPNITLDSGLSSALSAIETAARYLRTGQVRLALAAGVNGNSLPEFETLLSDVLGPETTGLAEGAFVFALTTERTANEEGLPVLAYVDGLVTGERGGGETIECGAANRELARYVGAAGGLGVLTALHRGAGRVSVQCTEEHTRLDLVVPSREDAVVPRRYLDAEQVEPGRRPLVRRHVPVLREVPADESEEPIPFLPPGVLVLTDDPAIATGLPLPADATVLCTAAQPVTPEAVRRLLAERPTPVRHVRLVTAFGAARPSLMALHDAVFLTIQAAGQELASLIALIPGGLVDGVAPAMSGLFTGLLKCADLELPDCRTFVLGTASADLGAAIAAAERESGRARTFPVVFDDQGVRRVPTLVESPAELPGSPPARLGPDSVVVAVGGARGITAEVVKALARDFGCRIYLFGSNRLEDQPDSMFPGDDATFAAGRTDFIRENLAGGKTVAALNREYDRIQHARAARTAIAEMRAHSGEDRVSYLVCDVTDPDAVTAAAQKVLADAGHVDLLVNAAGRNHSALIKDKEFTEFRQIRDIKVAGYHHLKEAFADNPPGLWCNFGSLLGFFGQRGEPDYASGNDFLAAAATHAAAAGNAEYTVGWTFWDGVGMVGQGGSLANTHFKRVGSYSDMTVAEGIHHFVRELHAGNRAPATVHLGDAERRMVDGLYPGYLDGPRGRFYLRRPLARTDRSVTFETRFDLARDGYLADHLVRGVPALPGAFVAEIAAEAALRLVPDATVVGFSDVRLRHFLHVYPEVAATPKRIRADLVESTGNGAVVEVQVVTDVVSPAGLVLVKDRPHFSTRVHLAGSYPAAPEWPGWASPERDVPAEESFRAPGAPIQLGGPFLCVHDIHRSGRRARARFRIDLAPEDPVRQAFVVPPYLFDAMVRIGFVTDADGRDAPVGAPTRIDRVDLYADGNDSELMERHGSVGLYATGGRDDPGNEMLATTPDGRVIARMRGVRTTLVTG
jgi:NAD(P)-dependent dehydrogenase (short-subunit alcohol dehydrogenase family)/3-oxoacyl-(acyl-carrier-protein) synthase